MRKWAGPQVRQLIDLTLSTKGTTCHLCGLPGADSADHDPPRSVLVRAGVANPDAAVYLFPAHWTPCNNNRKAKPLTPELRAELRAARLSHLGQSEPVNLSPMFADRARFFDGPSTG
jgi:hypothetical protein